MDTMLTSGRARLGGWLAITATAGLLVGLVAGPVLAGVTAPRPSLVAQGTDTTPAEHTISVAGMGKVTVIPDMATVGLGVLVEKPTAAEARSAAASAMTAVVAAIRKLGIADKDIATSVVSLNVVYDYFNNGGQKIRGYQLQNLVTVTVRNLDNLSPLIDDTVAAGATTVNGISFDVADRATAESAARQAAVRDARARADMLASTAGVRITGVASISEQVSTPPWYTPMPYAAASGAKDSASTPVLPGSSDVTISVAVVYTIG
jgi:uncharacterized protein YggE